MTNGEKIKEIFPSTDSRLDERTGIMLVKWVDGATKCFKADWWNAEYVEPTTKYNLAHNLCDSCINYGCEFQSGIVRTECAFYIPPQLEPDNCGNYVVQESFINKPCVSEKQCEHDKNVVIAKIKAEIEKKVVKRPWLDFEDRERDRNDAFLEVLDILDKYRSESEDI